MKFEVLDANNNDFARTVIELPFMPAVGHRLRINRTLFEIISTMTWVQDFTEQLNHSLAVKKVK